MSGQPLSVQLDIILIKDPVYQNASQQRLSLACVAENLAYYGNQNTPLAPVPSFKKLQKEEVLKVLTFT